VAVHAASDHRSDRWAWREAGPDVTTVSATDGIVFLHGLGGSRISWEPQLAALTTDHRVIAWDLPGYGDGPILSGECGPAPFSFPLLADAIVAFVDEVFGRPDAPKAPGVHIVGISFGGMIAQHAAALHPDRFASLTLLSTSPRFGMDGTSPEAWRAARLAPLDAGQEPIDFADAVLRRLAGPHISEEALAGQRAAMGRVSGAALRRAIDCLVTHDSRALLGAITAPTLCLVGELDDETPVAYSRYLADHIPGAQLVVVPGAGHLLNVEAADAVNDRIREHVLRNGRRS
jgi:3-oxoadipate enol-lactonase